MMEQGLRQEMIRVCRWLAHQNLVAATDGNLSAREGERLLVTPSGVNKLWVQARELIWVDLQGRPLAGESRPTSEILLHLEAYRVRPEIGAVIHAHPPVATALTLAGVSLLEPYLPEVVLTLGGIPTAPYATTGTPALAAAVRDLLPYYDAILLAQHGALTLGRDLRDAYNKMAKVEHAASIVWMAQLLGGAKTLAPDEAVQLLHLGIKKGWRPPAAANLLTKEAAKKSE